MEIGRELDRKINDEYENFFLDQMLASRENIFARSAEIEAKKMLANRLHGLAWEVDDETGGRLAAQTNLLDSYYRFWTDEKLKDRAADDDKIEREWLDFIAK